MWWDDLKQDVRFAARTLRRAPGFVIIAVLCLALGIGANGLVFSVVNGVLLRPLSYPDPERLVVLGERNGGGMVSWPTFLEWKQQTATFERMTAFTEGGVILSGEAAPERLMATRGTADYFAVHGVAPLLGRTFESGEDLPGRAPVAVLGEAMWRRRFGADPSVLGRTLVMDGVSRTVVGVMPASFSQEMDVWLPLETPADSEAPNRSHILTVRARLGKGVSVEQADALLKQLAARMEALYPAAQKGRGAAVLSLSQMETRAWRTPLQVLLGAVGLVLLIACTNVANLLLARAGARQQELAIRVALGARRGRLVRQFLVESLLLALVGGGLGVLLAGWGLSALLSLTVTPLPHREAISLDGTSLLFVLGVSVASGLAFGLGPALRATRLDVRGGLAGAGAPGGSSRANRRLRGALVVAELGLTLVLLVGAGLLGRAFFQLMGTSPGFAVDHVLTAHLAIPRERFADGDLPRRLFEPVLEQVRALPGVRAAGMTSLLPIQRAWSNLRYTVEGEPPPDPGETPSAERRASSPGYFSALEIPLLAGRDFTARDAEPGQPPVVIVNETLARRHFPEGSALGRRLLFAGGAATIVGVVGDVRQAGLDKVPLAELHVPYGRPWGDNGMVLVLRTGGGPEGLTPALREVVRRLDSDVPVHRALTMEQVIEQSLGMRRLVLWLLGGFAVVALVLSSAGLYGVISYLVSQQTREIGIRMALGARSADVLWLVMGHGALLAGAGIGLGLAGALALARVLESQLYGVTAHDPLTFGGVAALLGAVALLACWLPARRATRVDPLLAIRSD